MAREKITDASSDVTSGGSAIIMDIVMGEQLELPVTLDMFTEAAIQGYDIECVVIEGDNDGAGTKPTAMKSPTPVETDLEHRIPNFRNAFNPSSSYDVEDVVSYTDGLYYKLFSGTSYQTLSNPTLDPLWEEHDPTTIYIQFPSSLGGTWAPQPDVALPVWGFIELRVTEPANPVFQRTWKPMRGLIRLFFSPTDLVV